MKRKTAKRKKRISQRYAELPRSVFAALQRLGILQNAEENRITNQSKKAQIIGVAVSGGADSVALLRLLLEVRELQKAENTFEIAVLHFNHQLRGRAADADEIFMRRLAEKFGLPFYLESADIGAVAKRAKRNVEDAGRRERYAFFTRLVDEGRVDWVATAHTMDDQAETVLAHVLRGTGLAGLGGIHARSANVLRPLLGVRRVELRKYLTACKQIWREDATNRDTSRMRARIRKTLIPLLEKQFQSEVVGHLAQLAAHAREDEEFLEQAATEKLRDISDSNGSRSKLRNEKSAGSSAPRNVFRVPVEDLIGSSVPAALRGRMVRSIVKACKQGVGELGAGHVADILNLAARGENGKFLRLPGGVEVRRDNEALTFQAATGAGNRAEAPVIFDHEIGLKAGETTVRIPLLSRVFRFRKIDWLSERGETSDKRAAIDCSRLTGHLVLRNWRAGDRLQPAGRSGVYKLKRLLNAAGVSRWERNGWPVLTSDDVLVWVRGFPVAAEFAAGKNTRVAVLIEEEPL